MVAVLADLPGPKVRAASFPDGGTVLARRQHRAARAGGGASTRRHICVDYPTLLDDLDAGDRVVIGDGAISLRRATSRRRRRVDARCSTGGQTQGCPGVHLPAERLRLTTPTDEDLELAAVMVGRGRRLPRACRSSARGDDLRKVRDAVAPATVPPRRQDRDARRRSTT